MNSSHNDSGDYMEFGSRAYYENEAADAIKEQDWNLKQAVKFSALAGVLGGMSVLVAFEEPQTGAIGLVLAGIGGISALVPAYIAKQSFDDTRRYSDDYARNVRLAENAPDS